MLGSGDNGEHNGVSVVEISKICVTQVAFRWTEPFYRVFTSTSNRKVDEGRTCGLFWVSSLRLGYLPG